MQYRFFFLILLFLPGWIFAQTSDFDLSSYKLPNLKRHSLETTIDLYGQNQYAQYITSNDFNSQESWNHNLSGNSSLRYLSYLNTSDEQTESEMGVKLYNNLNKQSSPDEWKSTYGQFIPSLWVKQNRRKYAGSPAFTEMGLLLDYSYMRTKFSQSGDYYSNIKDLLHVNSLQMIVPVKFGSGRIEQVQDARHAIYLVDELTQAGRFNGTVTNDEIIRFAELISQLKNERFFDARHHMIHELEVVDSFLLANGYATQRDARYFSVLQDYWRYGSVITRMSGHRFSFAFYPGIFAFDMKGYSKGSFNILPFGKQALLAGFIHAGPEIVYEKPIGLAWQNSVALYVTGGFTLGKFRDFELDEDSKMRFPLLEAGFSNTFGYYPNTRTSVNFHYACNGIKIFDSGEETGDILGTEVTGIRGSAGLEINYYISPQLRLNFSSSLSYQWQDSPDYFPIDLAARTSSGSFLNVATRTIIDDYFTYYSRNFSHKFQLSFLYSLF
ncbi:MAG: hypothetical protein U0T82_12735 [Bacteroidales bacterium]